MTLEIINDGVHVHPEVVRLAFAGAPGRVALITDAMAAAGSADGSYLLGSLEVVVEAGVARLARGRLDRGLDPHAGRGAAPRGRRQRHPARTCGRRRSRALPAAAIGRERDLGRLEPGFAADAVLLGDALDVQAVWGAGARLAAESPAQPGEAGPEACSPSPPDPRPFDRMPSPPSASDHRRSRRHPSRRSGH